MSQINSNIKDDFQVVLLLSCFVGHPILKILSVFIQIFVVNVKCMTIMKDTKQGEGCI